MTVLFRKSAGGGWTPTTPRGFSAESELQKLLHESPELILSREEEKPAIFMREASLPGSGYIDLVGVDATGTILIVETKLAKNREIRREVIGQILEYAAYLWGMSFEQFTSLFRAREGKDILELFRDKSLSLSAEDLEQQVTDNLSMGRFKLIVAVDEMNPELDKIIAYLSSLKIGLQLEALEVRIYQSGELEIFVPQRHGRVAVKGESRGSNITTDEILASCPDEHHRKLYALLIQEWERLGNSVHPGTAGASFKADIKGNIQPIFWAFPETIKTVMSMLNGRGVPQAILIEYRRTLSSIPKLDSKRFLHDAKPTIALSRITSKELTAFIEASQRLVESWRNSEVTSQS